MSEKEKAAEALMMLALRRVLYAEELPYAAIKRAVRNYFGTDNVPEMVEIHNAYLEKQTGG